MWLGACSTFVPASRGSAPSNRIWNKTTLRSPKQQIWLRTALCGGWCRHMGYAISELHARNDDDDVQHSGTVIGLLLFSPGRTTIVSTVSTVCYSTYCVAIVTGNITVFRSSRIHLAAVKLRLLLLEFNSGKYNHFCYSCRYSIQISLEFFYLFPAISSRFPLVLVTGLKKLKGSRSHPRGYRSGGFWAEGEQGSRGSSRQWDTGQGVP